MDHVPFIAPPGKRISLEEYDPDFTGKYKDSEQAGRKLEKDLRQLKTLQNVLYAQNVHALLLIFQARDAAGKDSTVKHVMLGVHPQVSSVTSFKVPSEEELDHDFLWRCHKALPRRGRIGIFIRSYYEEVLVVKVHNDLLLKQHLPVESRGRDFWKNRYEDINNFERFLSRNGTVIIKFFLNVSKKEQKKRFQERIHSPKKNWKFSLRDIRERRFWEDYTGAYEDMFYHTSTKWAPWYVIPADHKWFTRAAVADIIVSRLRSLNLDYPIPADERQQELVQAKALLESE